MSINKRKHIFTGLEEGHYTLPEPIETGQSAVMALAAMKVDQPDVRQARDALTASVVAAARDGKPLPDTKSFMRVLDAQRAANELTSVLRDARQRADLDLDAFLTVHGEEIIVEHLRPAHDEAVAAGKAAVETLTAAGLDALSIAKADEALARLVEGNVRDARTAFIRSRARYNAVRNARGRLIDHAMDPPSYDVDLIFGWARNMNDIRRPGWQSSQGAKPWPENDPLAFWHWALTGPAELWCPTPEEQDARWQEVYGDAAQRMTAGQVAAGGGIYVGPAE